MAVEVELVKNALAVYMEHKSTRTSDLVDLWGHFEAIRDGVAEIPVTVGRRGRELFCNAAQRFVRNRLFQAIVQNVV